jgi:ribosomal protein S18 acetylase RimI-like enzyme
VNGFVRAARASDAADLARIQVACWRHGYAGIVPGEVLAELTSAEAETRWRDRWTEAITKPPTSRHHVLVAVTAPGASHAADPSRAPSRMVAGFASAGPAGDGDRWPGTDAELFELRVAPELAGHGHGSRLLNAVAATLAGDHFTSVSAWALEADTAFRRFLESAGWAPDGARSELDMGTRVPVIRLHTLLPGGDDPPDPPERWGSRRTPSAHPGGGPGFAPGPGPRPGASP